MVTYFGKIKEIKQLCWGAEDEHYKNNNFIINNEIYNKLEYKFIQEFKIIFFDIVYPNKRFSFNITPFGSISDKQLAFSNICIKNINLIDDISLEINCTQVDKIYNLKEIRQPLYKIFNI